MKSFFQYFSDRYLSRWILLLFDISVVPFAYFVAFLLRFNFDLSDALASMQVAHFAVILPVFLFCFLRSKIYSGILRHSKIEDISRIVSMMTYCGLILILMVLAGRQTGLVFIASLPISVIIIMNLAATAVLVFSRLMAKTLFRQFRRNEGAAKKVIIFGTGHLAQVTYNALHPDVAACSRIVGFIDHSGAMKNKHLFDIPVYSVNMAFEKIIPERKVSELIFAVEQSQISIRRKREITEMCLASNLLVKEVPPVEQWINGELQARAIRKVNITDLLGREAILLDHQKIQEGLRQSVVLVTGAAGSIGSEIVRQVIAFGVKRVILLDKAESELYNLQQEILARHDGCAFDVIVGDITNIPKLRRIFARYLPTMVINSAAYKHVPLMEAFPCEALRVNVWGTKILADLAVEYGVEKFVLISTDKAVNPTNVMGATKRLSEIYIQALSQSGGVPTKFITTRFGNVLGSSGSVVQLFERQIERGGPVTVTHPGITRYFMTIPEASQLVLEAGFMGNGGEIFVFDMGQPVKIHDLAKNMILLSGLVPGKDIKIKVTGLRPGEKLYEELLDGREELLPTYNDKIFIGKVREVPYAAVNEKISELMQMVEEMDEYNCQRLIERIQMLVPEFIPANPSYQHLVGSTASEGLAGRQADNITTI